MTEDDVNEQIVITYKDPKSGATRVYGSAYDELQAKEAVRACAATHGSLRTEIRTRFAEDVWKELGHDA